MAWPKGVPRKGYIKKPKSVHINKGKAQKKADPIVIEDTASAYVLHGMVGSGAITEPCPNCLYAYADGGYCPECGWMKPIRIDPYGTHSGRRL